MADQSKLIFVNTDGEYEESISTDGLLFDAYKTGEGQLSNNGTDLELKSNDDATADANATADTLIKSGDKSAGTGNSGDIDLITGTSAGGARGEISLDGLQINANSTQIVNVADPTADQHAATKYYVDSTASGLDPKESCRLATTAVLSGTMTADDVAPTTGNRSYDTTAKTITWFAGQGPTAIDTISLVNGDRILVKNESATSGPSAGEGRIYNGIYERTSADVWTRAADHDGTPANEVSAGNFAFIEQGPTNSDTGWVLQGDGVLTLQTDNIVFVQFSGAGSFTGGDGIDITASVVSVDHDGEGLIFDTSQLALELNGGSLTKSASGLELQFSTTFAESDRAIAADKLASVANGEGASIIGIEDASTYYAGTDLEAVTNELESQIGGLTSSTYAFGEDNVLADNDSIYPALNKLDLKWGDLASTAVSEGASLVGVQDASSYFTGTDLEAVTNEIEAQIGGTTSTTYAFAEDNVLADNDFIYPALNKLDLKFGDLANTANGEGASLVGVEDSNGYYTGTDLETVLDEIGLTLQDVGTEIFNADTAGVNAGDLIIFTGNDVVEEINNTASGGVEFAFGMAKNTATSGNPVTVLHDGQVLAGVLTGAAAAFAAGDKVYYDSGASGADRFVDLSGAPSAAGSRVWQVGIATSANDLLIDINFIKKNS